jgi:cytoskeleton protein RodZ
MSEELEKIEQPELKSIGGILLLARTEAGLSQEDVAKKLYLSKTFIEHLENDDFDKLDQNPVFIRGYVRSYARLVNLPEEETIELLDKTGIKQRVIPKKDYMVPTRQVRAGDKKMRLITYGIVILILILLFIWWRSHVSDKQQSTILAPGTQQAATQPTAMAPAATSQSVTSAPTTSASNTAVKPAASVDANKIKNQLTMDNGKS